jgi:hypothetical protein
MPSTKSTIPQSGRYAIEEIFDTQLVLSCTDIASSASKSYQASIMEVPYYIDRAHLSLPKQSIKQSGNNAVSFP